jgi:hypothetical protein
MSKSIPARATGRWVLVGVILLAGVLLPLYLIDPTSSAVFPPCPLHRATGLYCPGCGSTRAVHCLLHGDLSGALSKNPLLVIAIPFVVLLYVRPAWARAKVVPWTVLALVVAYGVMRNVDAFPFTLLAPH